MPFLSGPRARFNELTKHGYRGFERIWLFLDMTYCWWRFHCRSFEYFNFEYMNRKNRDRKNFLLLYHQSSGYDAVNKSKKAYNSKSSQYKLFGDMICREYIAINESDFGTVAAFAAKHGKVLFKPEYGTHGNGIVVYEQSEGEVRLKEILDELSGKRYLCEQYLVQHPEMAKLSASSVNTLRVLTLNDNGNVKIIDAAVRMGTEDRACDNLCNGGLAATVDVETGIVLTVGMTSKRETLVYHPVTGQKIVGFNIPMWDRLKAMVTTAAQRMADFPIRGWDIAITPDGPCIIEVNSYPGSRLNQLMDQRPKGREVIEYINKNSNASERRRLARTRNKNRKMGKHNGKA